MQTQPPLRMYTSEVCRLARFSQAKLNRLRRQYQFPDPVDRGREAIYDGRQVYRALGLLDEAEQKTSDPIMDALEEIKV